MAELELRGYLTTGKFQVNDYTIEIERVENGVRMSITDGDGKVKRAVIRDGEAGITKAEGNKFRELYNLLSKAYSEWSDNEQDRTGAEKTRVSNEKVRQTLYNQMVKLKDELPDAKSTLEACTTAKNEAVAAKEAAKTAAISAADAEINIFKEQLFYKDGDTITIGDSGTAGSTSLNATGYCCDSAKVIHLKIPMAKRLDYVTKITCQSFVVHIANSGGFGVSSTIHTGGNNYGGCITSIYADKVQNCIHMILKKTDGFNLKSNECVNIRIGSNRNGVPAVKFTLACASLSTNNVSNVSYDELQSVYNGFVMSDADSDKNGTQT